MRWRETPFAIPLFLAAVVLILIALYVWRRRRGAPGATAFVTLMVAGATWGAAYALSLGATDLPVKIFWGNVKYTGILLVPAAWLVFALRYTGRAKTMTRPIVALLAVEPVFTLLLIFTNEAHDLFWRSREPSVGGAFPTIEPVYGPWFWVNLAYSYLLISIATFLLVQTFVLSAGPYRSQRIALLVGTLIPWTGNAANVFGLIPPRYPDPAPFAFVVTGAVFAWALFRRGLLDAVPVARDAVVEGMGDGMVVLDVQDRIVDLNPAARRIFGLSVAETVGRPVGEIMPGRAVLLERHNDAEAASEEVELVDGPGPPRAYELSVSSLRDGRGRRAGRLIMLRDVTERRRIEDTLRRSEQRFRAIFENTALGISIADRQRRLLETNRAYQEMVGYDAEELFGKPIAELSHPDDVTQDRRLNEALLSGSVERYQREKRYIRKDGELVWVRPAISAVRNADGEPEFLVGVVEDITERKRAEEALKESEERFRQLFDRSVDALLVHDERGRIMDCNAEACRSLGYSREELLSLSVGDFATNLLSEEERAEREAGGGTLWQRALTGESSLSSGVHLGRHRRKDDTTFPVEVRVGPVDYGGRRLIFASARDITRREAAEEALRASEEKYRTLVETVQEGIGFVDDRERITYCNRAYADIFDLTPEELVGRSLLEFLDDDQRLKAQEQTALRKKNMRSAYEISITSASGKRRYLSASGTPILDGDGWFRGAVHTVVDITERKHTEEALRASESHFRRVVESLGEGLVITDLDDLVLDANSRVTELTGYAKEDLLGHPAYELLLPLEERRRALRNNERRARGLVERYVTRLRRKNGTTFWGEVTATPYRDPTGKIVGTLGSIADITERKALEQRLAHQAFHDALTGLPNRAFFADRLERSLAGSGREVDGKVAILFLDLDNFKYVNDSLGHEAGDRLLVEASRRLRRCLRAEDVAARLGGDEFAALLEHVQDTGEATRVAERIVEELREPFILDGQEAFVTPSIGIACGGGSLREGPEDLLRDADVAMYRAKEEGKARYRVFDPAMKSLVVERLGLENDLRRALERDEFVVHYQPVVALDTGRIIGFEALARWQHPERGCVSPAQFVPLAEEIGLIASIGRRILHEACLQTREWQIRYPGHPSDPPLIIGVNLSAKQLSHPRLTEDIRDALRESGLDPAWLTLEITESAVVGNGSRHIDTLHELRAAGVRFALDDFGVGYSSLSYLKHLPVGMLKIDRSFVEKIEQDPEDEVLVSGMVHVAKGLGLRVLAEGVETPDQLARVEALGCDLGQGYLFSEPLPAEEAGRLLTAARRLP
ncbi:PAS domain S-box protein [Rubrobacter tropicus]|nr:PAS domain S-box protein [Rubrobacter tropicus]